MSPNRLNTLFFVLLGVCGLLCLVLPSHYDPVGHGSLDFLLAPVAQPIRAAGAWTSSKLSGGKRDSLTTIVATTQDLRDENAQLRARVVFLMGQLSQLQSQFADADIREDLRPYCEPFSVQGADSGDRQSLVISSAKATSLRTGMAVFFRSMLVGRIVNSALGSAHVQLITDSHFGIKARFARIDPDSKKTMPIDAGPEPFAQGDGNGGMVVLNLNQKDVATTGPAVGDFLILWSEPLDAGEGLDPLLHGRVLGRVASIKPARESALFANIEIQPEWKASQIDNVMVKTRK